FNTMPGSKLFSTVGPSKNLPTPLDTNTTRFSGNNSISSKAPVYVFLTLAFVFLTIVIDGNPYPPSTLFNSTKDTHPRQQLATPTVSFTITALLSTNACV